MSELIHSYNISKGLPVLRYSLKEVFNSPKTELVKFKSRSKTCRGFYFFINNLAVLQNEMTVIGVRPESGENLIFYLLTKIEI